MSMLTRMMAHLTVMRASGASTDGSELGEDFIQSKDG